MEVKAMINKIQPYEKLVDYIKNNPQKGLTISHIDVEQILGIPYRKNCHCLNSKYSYQVARANKKLTALSLRLEAIQGFGYRIIKDNQYVDSMRKAYNTGVRNIQKAKFIADNTDVSALSTKEYKEFDAVYTKIVAVQNSASIIPTTKKNP
jgi:hypothetical protein